MQKILFIPIDNRPVCYDLAKMTASLDLNVDINLPPINLLGDLYKIADIEAILNWINDFKQIDKIILSMDTVAYGGLIPSRRSNDDIELIKKRISKLFRILKEKSAKIYAFSSIMRISNNNINEEEKEYWNEYGTKIFKYSYETHKSGTSNIEIPSEILEDYLLTRNRNFQMNKFYIDLKKQGLIDTLIFSKDDCAQFGLNVQEANELEKYAQNEENIFIKTGADEIPLSLLSRALNKSKRIKVATVYTNPDSINKISKYEDISVKNSVNSQIELNGGILSNTENCDIVLVINNFKNEQGELVMNIKEPLFNTTVNLPNKPFFVADILNANGSDNNFVKFLFENVNLNNFYGYARWNTTGNTLGSAISCALTYFKAQLPNKEAFNNLQITRLLDDWAYQANVRSIIRDNPLNLNNNIIFQEMAMYEQKILKMLNVQNRSIKYSFPWNRFFEIRIKIANNI